MVRSRRGVGLLATLGAVLLVASPALGKQATVTLNDGRTFTGELTSEDPQRVVLTIAGIATPIARADIARVEVRQSIEEEYQQKRSQVTNEDVEGRLAIGQWLLSNRALALAQQEGRDLQRVAPEHERVRSFNAAVDAAIQLERQGPAVPAPRPTPPANNRPAGAAATPPNAGAAAEDAAKTQLLDAKQITLIKVWELPSNLRNSSMRVQVPRAVVEEVFAKFPEDPAVPKGRPEQRDFFTRSSNEQMEWLFDMATRNVGVREYYDDVTVPGDPDTIIEFRRAMYTSYIQRYFRRHFVQDAPVPGLVIYANEADANAELYTNLYILSQTKIDGQMMINRTSPRQSLLLQWGLPRESASYPAPDVPGWRPFFTGLQDPNFDRFVKWIDSLYDTAGDYGIQFVPAGGNFDIALKDGPAAPAPAATPAPRQSGSPARPTTARPQ